MQRPTEKELRAIYELDLDATVALFISLFDKLESFEQRELHNEGSDLHACQILIQSAIKLKNYAVFNRST